MNGKTKIKIIPPVGLGMDQVSWFLTQELFPLDHIEWDQIWRSLQLGKSDRLYF